MCEDTSDGVEDDWFFNSMKRYKQISMFDFGYMVSHIERSDVDHICIVGRFEHLKKDEIMEVILPRKLLVHETEEGLERDNDLKIERGGFATSKIFQIKATNKRKLISSEEDKFGVSIYEVGSESSGIIERLHEYSSDHFEPCFSFNGINNILLATTNRKPLSVMDLITGQVIQTISIETSVKEELLLEPEFMSESLSAICNKATGSIHVKDIRNDKDSVMFDGCSLHPCVSSQGIPVQQVWTLSSPYQYPGDNSRSTLLACVSTGGQFLAYDLRNSKTALCSALITKLDAVTSNNISLKTTLDFGRFSVSGFDEKVYIYDIDEQCNLKLVFTHDGHTKETKLSKNIVQCHMFLKDDLLLSADATRSLHCWQFVPYT